VTLVMYSEYLFNPVDVVLRSPPVHLFVFIDSALGRKDPKNRWNPSRMSTLGLDVSGYGFSLSFASEHISSQPQASYQDMALAISQGLWTKSGFSRYRPDQT
jgi:hypothetical protein